MGGVTGIVYQTIDGPIKAYIQRASPSSRTTPEPSSITRQIVNWRISLVNAPTVRTAAGQEATNLTAPTRLQKCG